MQKGSLENYLTKKFLISKEQEIFYYASSFQSFLLGLSIATKTNCTFLTHTKNIVKSTDFFNQQSIIHKKHNLWEIAFKPFVVKKRINKLINNFKCKPFYFSHHQQNIFCILLAQFYSKKENNVFFIDFEQDHLKSSFTFSINYLKTLFFKYLINIIYRSNLIVKNTGRYCFLGLSKKDINKFGIRTINCSQDYHSILKNYLPTIDSLSYRNIYLHQPNESIIDQRSLNKLYEFLEKHNIHFKPHPRDGLNKFKIKNKNVVKPDFFPYEIFAKNTKNSVISINSSALIGAFHLNNKLKIISVLEILEWKDQKYKNDSKKYLIENIPNILFPKTFEELLLLIDTNNE